MNQTESIEALDEREVTFARVIDAPRELVFKAWTDAEHLAKWWGPKGMTNPVCEFDPKPGGKIYIVMRAPDGSEYPMGGVVEEVSAPERLVFSNFALAPDGSHYLDGHTTVTFAEHEGKTLIRVVSRAKALVPIANQMLGGMQEGWSMSLDKLVDLVADTSDREIVTNREFAAPRELVFSAWKNPERISHWWGPEGFTTTTERMEFRDGGEWRFVMHGPDGVDYQNRVQYVEIIEPMRIVYRHAGEGKDDAVRFESTVTFAEWWGGKTLVTMKMVFPTAAMRKELAEKYGAVEGAVQTLERLAKEVEV